MKEVCACPRPCRRRLVFPRLLAVIERKIRLMTNSHKSQSGSNRARALQVMPGPALLFPRDWPEDSVYVCKEDDRPVDVARSAPAPTPARPVSTGGRDETCPVSTGGRGGGVNLRKS